MRQEITPYNLHSVFVKSVVERIEKDAAAKRVGYRRGEHPKGGSSNE